MSASFLFALSIIGGVLYRLRGGGYVWTGSTQLARASWAAGCGVIAGIIAGNALLGAAVGACAFLGLILTGHAAHMSLGRSDALPADGMQHETVTFWLPRYNRNDPLWKREAIDAAGMFVIGAVRGLLLLLPLAVFDMNILFLALFFGVLHAQSYLVAWRAHDILQRNDQKKYAPFDWRPTDAAECIYGMLALPLLALGVLWIK